jgi:predicted ABC-type ATPase
MIVAGQNGAGKTTFADEYVASGKNDVEFVNADEIARDLQIRGLTRSDVLAGRNMLKRIDELVDSGADFALETTLATLTYARKIPVWRLHGYVVTLAYLRLVSVDQSLARVRKRVAAGGHSIPEPIIQRRFGKSLLYFETVYKPIVDEWYVWESREGTFALSEMGRRPAP